MQTIALTKTKDAKQLDEKESTDNLHLHGLEIWPPVVHFRKKEVNKENEVNLSNEEYTEH